MWNPELCKVALDVHESHDHHDRYAIAILENDTLSNVLIVRREMNFLFSFKLCVINKLLQHYNIISCHRRKTINF